MRPYVIACQGRKALLRVPWPISFRKGTWHGFHWRIFGCAGCRRGALHADPAGADKCMGEARSGQPQQLKGMFSGIWWLLAFLEDAPPSSISWMERRAELLCLRALGALLFSFYAICGHWGCFTSNWDEFKRSTSNRSRGQFRWFPDISCLTAVLWVLFFLPKTSQHTCMIRALNRTQGSEVDWLLWWKKALHVEWINKGRFLIPFPGGPQSFYSTAASFHLRFERICAWGWGRA